jgi:outer membrane protein
VITDAQGQHWQALSELLPNVVTDTRFGIHQINVKAALGITIPGQPPIIWPFGYFESRVYLRQAVFDWSAIERARASQAQLKSAEFSSRDARELVVLVIVSTYLLAIADESEVG